MDSVVFATAVENKVSKEFSKTIQIKLDKDDYYSHPTFRIENVWDYIHLVTIISSLNEIQSFGNSVVFRGASDYTYKLLPGLARLENPSEVTETQLINEFFTRRPDAFRGLSDFDTIAKMQHYGLPTRLLDFSTNPLVALYFACEDKPKTDGRVVCHNTFLQNDSSPFVSAICSIAVKKSFDARHWIDIYLKDEKISLQDYLLETYLYKETTVVRPKYWNQRIANQSGVFMVFPNNLRDRYMEVLTHTNEKGLSAAIKKYGIGVMDIDLIKEMIEKEPIEYYKQNEDFFISSSVFDKILTAHIIDENLFRWDDDKFFCNRFLSSYYLKELREDTIREDCCSIIIEGKNKKRILEELSSIGITNDFIYPELEYSAKEIKRKFHI